MKDNIEVVIDDVRDDCGNATGRKSAAVLDRKGNRAWTAEGPTENTATTEAVRKFIGDRRAREYTP